LWITFYKKGLTNDNPFAIIRYRKEVDSMGKVRRSAPRRKPPKKEKLPADRVIELVLIAIATIATVVSAITGR